jgi:hypothetical protein
LIGSKRSQRCRKPSVSGAFGVDVAGIKYGAIVPLSLSFVLLSAPAGEIDHTGNVITTRKANINIKKLRNIFIIDPHIINNYDYGLYLFPRINLSPESSIS